MKRAAVVTLLIILTGWSVVATSERNRAVQERQTALDLADQALQTGEGLAGQLRRCEGDLDALRARR